MEAPYPRPYSFNDPGQERIYLRLDLVGEGPAEFFRDACRLMDTPDGLSSTSHLVGHLMREIEISLRAVLKPQIADDGLAAEESEEGNHHRKIADILALLDVPQDHPVARLWFGITWKNGLHRWAHRDSLFRSRPVDQEFVRHWESFQTVLDFVLERMRNTYLNVYKLLDELAAVERPTRAHAKRLRKDVPNNLAAHSYFFDTLTSPDWLKPLAAETFFLRPAKIERDEDHFSFTAWPQSRYLKRVAAMDQEMVADIILMLPETDNVSVQTDLVEAATQMSPDQAVRIVDLAISWAAGPNAAWALLPNAMGALLAHLAKGGYAEEALRLARTLLALKPKSQEESESEAVSS